MVSQELATVFKTAALSEDGAAEPGELAAG
jgi:hypothetical protein